MVETLLRIDVPSAEEYDFLPYQEGVYFAKLTKDSKGYGPYYSQWTSSTINTLKVSIGSVIVDQASFDRKTSLADCVSDDASFFWDDPAQTLYIHFVFDDIPETTSITIGIQEGYSYIGTSESIYIDDIKYEPLIINIPNIRESVDKFQLGKMRFRDLTIRLKNGDAQLDDFIQNPVPGAEASIVLYDTDTATELEYYTGFVVADTSTYAEYGLRIEDKRRRENIKVPRTRFDATTYPDIEERHIGKVIPEGYGDVTRIPCTPLNGAESPTPTNIEFRYATDATTLTKVEVREDEVWTDVTSSVTGSSPSTGYFELPYADATNASGAVLECVFTGTLRSEENPGDIIADMNDRYVSVNYDSSNYDQTEWTSESAKLSDVALYMGSEKELFKWYEDLQNGTNLWFVYIIDGSGRRTIRVNDPDRSLARAIKYLEIKDDNKQVERDFKEFSSTVTVLYDKDEAEDVQKRIELDSLEDSIIDQYGFSQDSEFDSLLTVEADAQEKADVIYEDQQEVRPVVTVVLHGDELGDLDLKLYDIVTVDLSRPDVTYWSDVPDGVFFDDSAVDGYNFDDSATDGIFFSNGETVNAGGGREYFGTIRGQILEIGYNPTNYDYTIKVREKPGTDPTGDDDMPIGAVYWWPGAGTLPSTAKECNGQLLNIADYPDLYAVVGDTWNTTGDGSVTFNVPDIQGIAPGHIGTQDINGRTKGDGSAIVGDLIEDQFQGHYHMDPAQGTPMTAPGIQGFTAGANGALFTLSGNVDTPSDSGYVQDTQAGENGAPRNAAYTDVSRAMGRWLIQAL